MIDTKNQMAHANAVQCHPMPFLFISLALGLGPRRRLQGRSGPLELVFHTEMQRVDGHCQTPLQRLGRVFQ